MKIINGIQIDYEKHTPIISARFRADDTWGFECLCGQYNLLAPAEEKNINTLVKGGLHAIDAIKESLKLPDDNKFRMESI